MTEQDLMDPQRQPTLAGVERAAQKIAAILPPTPLLPLEIDGTTIWCKAESLQPIGAFKIRGGWHRLTDLDDDQKKRGVIGFSSGNHAQGVAWAIGNDHHARGCAQSETGEHEGDGVQGHNL